MRVTTVDENVALLQQRYELFDHRIDRRAGLDHNHHFARSFQICDKLFERTRPNDVLALRATSDEVVDLGCRAIENGDGVATRFNIEDEILAHDGQADQAKVSGCSSHCR